MKGPSDSLDPMDPFAGYTPVKVAHPVVDEDVSDLEPAVRAKRWKPPRRTGRGSDVLRLFVLLAVLLLAGVGVTVVGSFVYGCFYKRPVTDEIPELAVCARQVNALSDWGRQTRSRLSGLVGTNLLRRLSWGGGPATATNAVGRAVKRVTDFGDARRQKMSEAQRFADGFGKPD